jgi:NAD(P)-dependent dehydrogenase (short-subunit alcohol dehydrogenase family)
MKDVQGKVAFITGAASGIGLGLAQAFLEAGMKVALADVRRAALEAAAAGLGPAAGRYHLMEVDVTDRARMARAADEVVEVFGKVHVLCNNAGVSGITPMHEAGYEEWDWVLGVNLFGMINGVKSFLPKLRAHDEGAHILNTSSMAGLIPMPASGGIYATSKFAARGFSESLRIALAGSGVGVSVLCPGLVKTRMIQTGAELSPVAAGANGPTPFGVADNMFDAGVEPIVIGRRALQGIAANEAYILTHGEFHDELAEVFEEILAAFPPAPGPEGAARLAIENGRRQAVAAAKASLKQAG